MHHVPTEHNNKSKEQSSRHNGYIEIGKFRF